MCNKAPAGWTYTEKEKREEGEERIEVSQFPCDKSTIQKAPVPAPTDNETANESVIHASVFFVFAASSFPRVWGICLLVFVLVYTWYHRCRFALFEKSAGVANDDRDNSASGSTGRPRKQKCRRNKVTRTFERLPCIFLDFRIMSRVIYTADFSDVNCEITAALNATTFRDDIIIDERFFLTISYLLDKAI